MAMLNNQRVIQDYRRTLTNQRWATSLDCYVPPWASSPATAAATVAARRRMAGANPSASGVGPPGGPSWRLEVNYWKNKRLKIRVWDDVPLINPSNSFKFPLNLNFPWVNLQAPAKSTFSSVKSQFFSSQGTVQRRCHRSSWPRGLTRWRLRSIAAVSQCDTWGH